MSNILDQVVQNDAGQIIGFVYATDSGFEAWRRERLLSSSTPGNKHTYLGIFATRDAAIAALTKP